MIIRQYKLLLILNYKGATILMAPEVLTSETQSW